MVSELITTLFNNAYFATVTGTLSANFLAGLRSKERKQLKGNETASALQNCIEAGIMAVIRSATMHSSDESDLLAELLKSFFGMEETGEELAVILYGDKPDYESLSGLFKKSGYDPDTLPGIDFDSAISVFEPAFLAAAVSEKPLQSVIQTAELLKQSRLQREMVSTMKALVLFLKENRENPIGIQAGTIIAENVVNGSIQRFEPGSQPLPVDDGMDESAYLKQLIVQCNYFDLSVIDDSCTIEDREVRLTDVFTELYLKGVDRHEDQTVADALLMKKHKDGLHLKKREAEKAERLPVEAVEAAGAVQRIVILGQPGGGKSTLVNYIAARLALKRIGKAPGTNSLPGWADDKTPLPVRIILRRFAAWMPDDADENAPGLVWGYLEHMLGEWGCSEFYRPLKQTLQKTGGILFFDGLDEVREQDAEKKRSRIVRAIRVFSKSLDKCCVVVTCREYAYRKDDAWRLPETEFPVMELDLFREVQIRSFTKIFYQATGRWKGWDDARCSREAENLAEAVQTLKHLRELAQYPLLLTLMAQVHGRDGFLPENRADLYDRTIRLLLAHWENRIECDAKGSRKVEPGLVVRLGVKLGDLRAALERVALAAHERQEKEANGSKECADIARENLRDELAAGLGGSLDRAETAIRYIQQRAGLLHAKELKTFSFPHRTFQEYLAATGILRKGNFEHYLRVCLLRSPEWWWEVFLLTAGASRKTPKNIFDLMDTLLPNGPEADTLTPQNVLLARLCAQAIHETDFLKEVAEEARSAEPGRYDRIHKRVQAWLMRAMAADEQLSPLERVAAGNALNWVGDPRFDPDFYFLPKENYGFIEIPAGKFMMGSDKKKDPEADDDEMPCHEVVLSSYAIGKYPVTVAQFNAFMKDNGYEIDDPDYERDNRYANHPVVEVSWNDAKAYCEWLTVKLAERGGDYPIKLPTEAQWERAARGTDERIYPWGNDIDDNKLNYDGNIGSTSPVGCFPGGKSPCNALDMAGNVWEWCFDRFGSEYYADSPGKNPEGPRKGPLRVIRGGSWGSYAGLCRSAYRSGGTPRIRYDFRGFRLSRS